MIFHFKVEWSEIKFCQALARNNFIKKIPHIFYNKRLMGHITHLRNQIESKGTNDYIITLIN